MNDDLISRQAVLKAIDVKAWEFCDYLISKGRNDEQKPVSHFADNLRECVGEDLPSVKPQEPCDDVVSRKAVIEWLENATYEDIIDAVGTELSFLPSVNPQEPKTGHWNCGDDMFEYAICSSCKHETGEAWEYAKRNFKYCPNCGCAMKGE